MSRFHSLPNLMTFRAAAGLLCLFAGAFPLHAAEGTRELLPRWKPGEARSFVLVKTRLRSQEGKVTLNTTSRTGIRLEVLSADAEGYVLAWTFGETTFDDPRQAGNPLVLKLANILTGFRMVLELDAEASLRGVRNWTEIRDASTKALDAVTEELKAAGLDGATIAQIRTQTAAMYATKPLIEQNFTQEARLLFMVLGVEFAGSQPVEYEDQLPNPFGGEPFPSRARFVLTKVDEESGLATITWTQTIASAEARRIMEKTFTDLAARLGKPAPDAEALKNVTIEDSAEFTVEVSTGWIERFTHSRTTRTGDASQEDRISITRTKE